MLNVYGGSMLSLSDRDYWTRSCLGFLQPYGTHVSSETVLVCIIHKMEICVHAYRNVCREWLQMPPERM